MKTRTEVPAMAGVCSAALHLLALAAAAGITTGFEVSQAVEQEAGGMVAFELHLRSDVPQVVSVPIRQPDPLPRELVDDAPQSEVELPLDGTPFILANVESPVTLTAEIQAPSTESPVVRSPGQGSCDGSASPTVVAGGEGPSAVVGTMGAGGLGSSRRTQTGNAGGIRGGKEADADGLGAPVAPARRTPPHLVPGGDPPPDYPRRSRRLGETGSVLLRIHIDAHGSPIEVEVKTSSGFARLDDAAREAVMRWQFEPARIGEMPAPGIVEVTVRFELK